MAVFNTYQNRQLYVATAYKATVAETDTAGTLGAFKQIDNGVEKEMYFKYKGADTVLRSDLIQLKNLNYVKAVKASDMATKMKKVELTLDSTINSGAPVSGQDYILRIAFRQFYGAGDATQYFKDAAVHATANMSASNFYKAMVDALNKAFSREVGATINSNPYLTFSVDNTTTATKIIIEEKPQPWSLGTQAQERVYFDVVPTTIYTGGDDVIWGTATEVASTTTVPNGKKIADLEWFCAGERGDQYRQINWPNDIPTQYLVDATKEYSLIELHYAFTDTGVNSYRSEKDITIAVPNGTGDAKYTTINSIIGALETATGLTIADLSD